MLIHTLLLFGTVSCAFGLLMIGAVYLACEFVVLEGPFAKRKVWSMIGLYSPKGPEWGNIGRSFLRAILKGIPVHVLRAVE